MVDYKFLEDWKNKIVVIHGSMGLDGSRKIPRWQIEREKYLYNGVITNQNLRQILPNEVIIEFDEKEKGFEDQSREDSLKWVQKVKEYLVKNNINFKITTHGGISPHIRFVINGLQDYDFQVARDYKLKLVRHILKDVGFKSKRIKLDNSLINTEGKLISLEGKPHWKKKWNGNIEKILFENSTGRTFPVVQRVAEDIAEKLHSKTGTIDYEACALEDVQKDVLIKFFADNYTTGSRNLVLMAFGGQCRRAGLSLENSISILKVVLAQFDDAGDLNERIKELRYSFGRPIENVAVYAHLKNIDEQTAPSMYGRLLLAFKKKDSIEEIRAKVIQILIDRNKSNSEASHLVAEYILKKNFIYTVRSDQKEEVWVYRNGVFIQNGKTYIKEDCKKVLQAGYTSHFANEVIKKIETETYIEPDKFFIEEDKRFIPLQNGIFDLKTRELKKFSPKYRFFYKLPVSYDPDSKCNNIIRFFEEVLPKKEDKLIIQELFGYLLLREYRFEKAFMFLGNGRNGKGKTLEIIKRFLGAENCQNLSLKIIEKEGNFQISRLQHSLANLSGDLSKQALENTGNFKMLTGRDMVTADRKFLPSVNFVNYAKMLFAANQLPETEDLSDGFFNRWIILDFPYKFYPKNVIMQKSEEERANMKVEDPSIIEKICQPEELDGLFVWALEGYDRLMENGQFTNTKSGDKIRKIWLRKCSSLHGFLQDCCEYKVGAFCPKDEFRELYNDYCSSHKLSPVTDKKIKEILATTLGVGHGRRRVPGELDTREYGWKNLLVKDIDQCLKVLINDQSKNEVSQVSRAKRPFVIYNKLINSPFNFKNPRTVRTDGTEEEKEMINYIKEKGIVAIEELTGLFKIDEKCINWMLSQGTLYEPKAGWVGLL